MKSEPAKINSKSYLEPVSPLQVRMEDGFWLPRMQTITARTIKSQFQLLAQTGRLDNFKNAIIQSPAPFQGYFFNDSDVYKWLEAAIWIEAQDQHKDSETSKAIEDTIDLIAAAQQPDGYVNTYFMGDKAALRWSNLKDMHEMYCAGHLIQAAVADQRARNGTRLMAIARRLADHIDEMFGTGKRPGVPGHPEIELALVDLYRVTDHLPYLELARYFIDQRGKGIIGGNAYHLDHKPVRELDKLAGHAVRAMYLCTGAAGTYEFSGDRSLLDSLTRLWEKMVSSQMYVTGGLGARHEGESFGEEYELPNSRAYAETCAAIGSVMWNHQMFRLTRDSRYADLLEWTLYNAVLPGISLDGEKYFYENPLTDQGKHRRTGWFPCACCPPNVVRMLATYPGYLYATGLDGDIPEIYINGYAQSTASINLHNGNQVVISLETNYPWQGQIEILFQKNSYAGPIRLHMRIPSWTEGYDTNVFFNDRLVASSAPPSFFSLTQVFKPGDRIQVDLPMQPRWLASHPFVTENANRAALSRGPLVYCLESVDNPGIDLRLVTALHGEPFRQKHDLIFGILGLGYPALEYALPKEWHGKLYLSELPEQTMPRCFEAIAVPYFSWANRQGGQMQVWITSGRSL